MTSSKNFSQFQEFTCEKAYSLDGNILKNKYQVSFKKTEDKKIRVTVKDMRSHEIFLSEKYQCIQNVDHKTLVNCWAADKTGKSIHSYFIDAIDYIGVPSGALDFHFNVEKIVEGDLLQSQSRLHLRENRYYISGNKRIMSDCR